MIVSLAHASIHDLIAGRGGVSEPTLAADPATAAPVALLALVLIAGMLVAVIGRVLAALAQALALLGALVLGLVMLIMIAAMGLSGRNMVPSAPPPTIAFIPAPPPRPARPHVTPKPKVTPSTRPRLGSPRPGRSSTHSSYGATVPPTFVAARAGAG